MSYFGFLLVFLMPPLLVLAATNARDARHGRRLPPELLGQPAWIALVAHVIVAVVYTTPWDNYLVANQIWWYDPVRVVGLTLGWIPIEEYFFFVLQTLLTGSWLIYLARSLPAVGPPAPHRPTLRWIATLVASALWLGFAGILLVGWNPGTYMALELSWALIPIMLQLGFGADVLWHHRRLVALSIAVPTLYLSLADSIAIGAGTWTFSPQKSTGWSVGGVLPVEELLFFLLTNTLIGFGMTLLMSSESQIRFRMLVGKTAFPAKG